ncbi:MAG: glycosyltransferase [Ilumatobacter sp.]|uniref:bifunctional glycosyltransferase/CDP-glycerol:glycerophosphate glycerophosphotransferase n=1 Tax=Ilumatobacter sp. TaxID=1967498 RepID=UPI00391BE36B
MIVQNDTGRPIVSVIVAAFDEQLHLGTALESVAAQTFGDFECIVVDDASYDHTLDVAMEMRACDSRFRVIRHPENAGLSKTRNSGLAAARGTYVTFLDGDDFMFPKALERRIEALLDTDDEEVAGAFCDWVPVPHDAAPGIAVREPRRLGNADYFSSAGKPPFIASAPLLRTELAIASGGFDPDFGSAEDFEFWSRLMRLGYRFIYRPDVGIAYRQRRDGMVQGQPAVHAAHVDRVMTWQESDVDLAPLNVVAPSPFSRGRSHYDSVVRKTERLIESLALAIAADDAQQIRDVIEMFPADAHQVAPYALNVHGIARKAMKRTGLADETISDDELCDIARRTATQFGALKKGGQSIRSGLKPPDLRNRSGNAKEIREAARRAPSRGRFGGVVLVPLARYHTDELVPLAHALEHLGMRSSMLLTEREGPEVCKELWKSDLPVYSWPDELRSIGRFSAMLTLNDWGPTIPLAKLAAQRGALSIAKVEGVQDFEDADTGRIRRAYRRSDLVLCQGQNDVTALNGEITAVVGNSRLQNVWEEGERSFGTSRTAVINSNFTYNVLTGEKTGWLESVLKACRLANVRPLISQHHADGGLDADLPIATRPMKWLLKYEADLLISRFSTVPFEAMARGVPFVYHNPHDEKVPTFRTPGGSFATSASVHELAEAIDTALEWRGTYRERSAEFFAAQVSIDDSLTPAERAAQCIVDRVSHRR